jgi:hypothetical protein
LQHLLPTAILVFGVLWDAGIYACCRQRRPMTGRHVVTVAAETCSVQGWDDFAKRCGATFRGSYRASQMFGFDTHRLFRTRRFACYIGRDQARRKIAQAAISVGVRMQIFVDPVAILQGYETLWNEVMAALLAALGPGTYRYGCPWALETPRDFTGLVDRVDARRPINVYSINFSCWTSWSDYIKNASNNAIRQARRAVREHGENLTLETHWGFAALRYFPVLSDLMRKRFVDKQIVFNPFLNSMRYIARTISMGRAAFLTIARLRGEPCAALAGIAFGAHTYFINLGFQKPRGISWWLMFEVIRAAYERAPQGVFITGYEDALGKPNPGLDFFRTQCRAVKQTTEEILFHYALA